MWMGLHRQGLLDPQAENCMKTAGSGVGRPVMGLRGMAMDDRGRPPFRRVDRIARESGPGVMGQNGASCLGVWGPAAGDGAGDDDLGGPAFLAGLLRGASLAKQTG